MKFLSVQEAIKKGKGKVSIRGWIYRERKSNKFMFLVIRDVSNIIQCVLEKENVSPKVWEAAKKLLIESSVEIIGEVYKEKRAPTNYEISIKDLKVIHYAEKYPITKDQSVEFLADNRHLWLRSRKLTAILKIRSTVFGAIHEFFRDKGFFEFQSPMFQSTQCEGGSTLFEVKYYENTTFLAQTWQLYAEAAMFALEKIYTIAPSFRAEKSKTSRHLTEYWHAEMEVAWINFTELQDYAEDTLKYIVKKVLKENKEQLAILERDIKKLEPTIKKDFPRITYDKALKLLKEKKGMTVPWGKDLRTIEEDKLSEIYDRPIIVTNYPKQVKAFYMKEDEKNPKVVHGFDIIAPEHYGEIVGASEREYDIEELKKRLREMGEDPKNYEFYLDTRRYGSVPHGGFGLGIERVIAWICGLDNIKDAIGFPRTPLRHTP